jgi:hypothetical protein
VRWYINDVSLQGQFADVPAFEGILRGLIRVRVRVERLGRDLRSTRTLADRFVSTGVTIRDAMRASRDRDLRRAVLNWVDRTGPYVEDDRLAEADDYFEFASLDVTDSGLGEAARRIKAGDWASTFSFEGGAIQFAVSPLLVDHGLPEARLGVYSVENVWTIDDLAQSAINEGPPITSWQMLTNAARQRFPQLIIPDSIHQHAALAREPFEATIRDRALDLFGYLNAYMAGRGTDGAEGPAARYVIEKFFVGERALFSGESATNQKDFKADLTFTDPEDPSRVIFAHWHGKISRRFFRMHFEWPVPPDAQKLKIVYLGPKITKD